MATKELWLTMNPTQRQKEVEGALSQLVDIESKQCKIKKKMDQGRLAQVKKTLEQFLIDALQWESDRQLQRHY